MGQVAPVLESKTKEPIYLCSQCGKQFSQAAVAQAYRIRLVKEG
jgi:DNA-directed RNA polymerase subunit RPC12/RpoP